MRHASGVAQLLHDYLTTGGRVSAHTNRPSLEVRHWHIEDAGHRRHE